MLLDSAETSGASLRGADTNRLEAKDAGTTVASDPLKALSAQRQLSLLDRGELETVKKDPKASALAAAAVAGLYALLTYIGRKPDA